MLDSCLLAGPHKEPVTILEYFTSPTGRLCALVQMGIGGHTGTIDLEGIEITLR